MKKIWFNKNKEMLLKAIFIAFLIVGSVLFPNYSSSSLTSLNPSAQTEISFHNHQDLQKIISVDRIVDLKLDNLFQETAFLGTSNYNLLIKTQLRQNTRLFQAISNFDFLLLYKPFPRSSTEDFLFHI